MKKAGPRAAASGRRLAERALFALFVTVQVGCYHYRIEPAKSAPADEPHHATRHAFFWGALQNSSVAPDCMGNGVAEVHASTNFGYALVTVVTLGIWSPLDLEWRCAKDRVVIDHGLSALPGDEEAETELARRESPATVRE